MKDAAVAVPSAASEIDRALSQVLLENDLVSPGELARCWSIQEGNARSGNAVTLGQILIHRRLVDATSLSAVLRPLVRRGAFVNVDIASHLRTVQVLEVSRPPAPPEDSKRRRMATAPIALIRPVEAKTSSCAPDAGGGATTARSPAASISSPPPGGPAIGQVPAARDVTRQAVSVTRPSPAAPGVPERSGERVVARQATAPVAEQSAAPIGSVAGPGEGVAGPATASTRIEDRPREDAAGKSPAPADLAERSGQVWQATVPTARQSAAPTGIVEPPGEEVAGRAAMESPAAVDLPLRSGEGVSLRPAAAREGDHSAAVPAIPLRPAGPEVGASTPAPAPGVASAHAAAEVELGTAAVENGLLTQGQLDEGRSIQQAMAALGFPMALGKIFIQKHYLDRLSVATLARAIARRHRQSGFDLDTAINFIKLTDAEHKVLLAAARRRSLLSVEQVDACYDIVFALEKRGIDKQLGEVFIESGLVSREAVAEILAEAKRIAEAPAPKRRPTPDLPPPVEDDDLDDLDDEDQGGPALMVIDLDLQAAVGGKLDIGRIETSRRVRFGQLAVEKGLATQQQVDDAIYGQFRLKELGIQRRIGELLVEKKILEPSDLRRLLDLQKERMNQLSFTEVNETSADRSILDPGDQELVQILVENLIVSRQEVDECIFVVKSMKEMGIEARIGKVLVEKEYVDDVIVKGIYRQLYRRAQAADDAAAVAEARWKVEADQVASKRLRSSALAEAYEDVLRKLGIEDEDDGGPRRGIELRGAAARARPVAVPMRRRLFHAAASFLFLAASATVATFLATRKERVVALAEEVYEHFGPVARSERTRKRAADATRLASDTGSEERALGAQLARRRAALLSASTEIEVEPRKLAQLAGDAAVTTVVSVAPRSIPGEEQHVYLMVVGGTWYPDGTELALALEVADQVVDQRRCRLARPKNALAEQPARFATWFGPYLVQPPRPGERATARWLPAGRFRIAVSVVPGADGRRLDAMRLPKEGVVASADLAYPDVDSFAAVLRAQQHAIQRHLASIRQDASELAHHVEGLIEEIEGGGSDVAVPEIESLRLAASASKVRLDAFRQLALVVPSPLLFRMLGEFHEAILRLGERLALAAARPGSVASQVAELRAQVRQLDETLQIQLPAGDDE